MMETREAKAMSLVMAPDQRQARRSARLELVRPLEDLKERERTMYELDNRKDQVMTILKVALANLAMWVRDQYFPPSYAQAT